MRVAIFVSYLPPHVGGIEVVAETQMANLVASGCDVAVVSSACGAKAGLERSERCSVRRIWAWNYFERRTGVVFPVFAPSLISHSYRAVRWADIVHAHDSFYLTSLMAAFWAKILGKPLVLTQHVDMVPHPSRLVNAIQRLTYATTGRFVLKSSRKIIVLNARIRRFLINRGIDENDITFIPNGVDTRMFAPVSLARKRSLREKYGLPQDRLLALFVGRFVPKKNLAALLAMPPIENCEVVVVGGRRPDDYLRADRHFLGVVERPAMAEIYQLCDVFVLPSQGEGFPLTVQEAMASAMPIIMGKDSGYEPYSLSDSVIEFVAPTVTEIFRALRALVLDPIKRSDMAEYSRLYSLEYFSSDKHMKVLIALYEAVVAESGKVIRSDAMPAEVLSYGEQSC